MEIDFKKYIVYGIFGGIVFLLGWLLVEMILNERVIRRNRVLRNILLSRHITGSDAPEIHLFGDVNEPVESDDLTEMNLESIKQSTSNGRKERKNVEVD